MKIVVLGMIGLLAFISEGRGQAVNDQKTLVQADYALTYPSQWQLDQSGQMGTKFILFASEGNNGFRDNVNLMVQDLKGSGLDLDKYVSLSEGQVKTMISNPQIISSKRIKTDGGEFQEVIFTGDQGVLHLKWRQRYWVKGEKAYILTFTASQSTYSEYNTVNEMVLGSFKLK